MKTSGHQKDSYNTAPTSNCPNVNGNKFRELNYIHIHTHVSSKISADFTGSVSKMTTQHANTTANLIRSRHMAL